MRWNFLYFVVILTNSAPSNRSKSGSCKKCQWKFKIKTKLSQFFLFQIHNFMFLHFQVQKVENKTNHSHNPVEILMLKLLPSRILRIFQEKSFSVFMAVVGRFWNHLIASRNPAVSFVFPFNALLPDVGRDSSQQINPRLAFSFGPKKYWGHSKYVAVSFLRAIIRGFLKFRNFRKRDFSTFLGCRTVLGQNIYWSF